MTIRQHEMHPGTDRCRHCGAIKPGPDSTCNPRTGSTAAALAPEPARRQYACEDGDGIAARIAELREARQRVWNAVEPVEAQQGED